MCNRTKAALLAGVIALPAFVAMHPAFAQQPPAPAWPAAPAPAPAPAKPKPAAKPAAAKPASAKPASAKPAKPAAAAAAMPDPQVIRCDGAFAKDSSHAKLAEAFGADKVVFQQVDGPEGTKLNASVVFGDDPKRRIEVTWHEEEARQRPHAVILGPTSTWKLEKGLRVGMPLAEVEKQNGKGFKLMGFDWDNGGIVSDWQGGAYDKLAGGCRFGVRFETDPKAPAKAREKVIGDKEIASTDTNMRAVKPRVSELFINYPE